MGFPVYSAKIHDNELELDESFFDFCVSAAFALSFCCHFNPSDDTVTFHSTVYLPSIVSLVICLIENWNIQKKNAEYFP